MFSYDKAYELVGEIKGSPPYKTYQKAKDELLKNETALSLLREYRQKEMAIQQAAILGQGASEEDEKELSRLGELISIHGSIDKFLSAERQMMVILLDIQKIIGEGMKLLDI